MSLTSPSQPQPDFDEGARILVVEDEPLIGLAMRDVLERAGARVLLAENDSAAYTALADRNQPFDALILDIDLGHGTTGFDVARQARQLYPDVGVIFSSGSPSEWLESYGVPGAVYVPKPCSQDAIVAAVRGVVEERRNAA